MDLHPTSMKNMKTGIYSVSIIVTFLHILTLASCALGQGKTLVQEAFSTKVVFQAEGGLRINEKITVYLKSDDIFTAASATMYAGYNRPVDSIDSFSGYDGGGSHADRDICAGYSTIAFQCGNISDYNYPHESAAISDLYLRFKFEGDIYDSNLNLESYITDNFRVQRGEFVDLTRNSMVQTESMEDPGTGLDLPKGLAFDAQGNLWVVDMAHSRIVKFSNAGHVLFSFGTFGYAEGSLFQPTDIAIDNEGILYVLDRQTTRISKFTTEGVFISCFGEFGSGTGMFNPERMELDGSGNLIVSDTGNDQVKVFSTDGDLIKNIQNSPSSPAGIAVAPDGSIYVSSGLGGDLFVYDKDYNFLRKMYLYWGYMYDIFIDADARLYIAYTIRDMQGIVKVCGLDGIPADELDTTHKTGGFASDAQGNLYISDQAEGKIECWR